MATTKLWHISGRIKDLIEYVENPEKTVPKEQEDFFNVFAYAQRADKTKDEYVTAINCLKNTALQQMILTKKQYGKDDGYIAWHGYQSFKPRDFHRRRFRYSRHNTEDSEHLIHRRRNYSDSSQPPVGIFKPYLPVDFQHFHLLKVKK